MTREESLKLYYSNPNYCLNCGKIIEVLDNQRVSDVRRKKFCNHSCAASFNNKGVSRNVKISNTICPSCGGVKSKGAKLCKKCRADKENVGDNTLGYYINGHKYLTSRCQAIRRHARRVLEESNREKVCEYCRNHEFDEILEVHHLKGILQFDKDSLIREINSEDNLVWLCPNHHAMVEKGLIKLDIPRVSSVVE